VTRHRLSRAVVVDAAMALVDEVGVEGLSMRVLSHRLAVDPMAIYRHVRNKDELLVAMCDAVVEEVAAGALDTQNSWQDQLRLFAVRLRAALHRRPSMLPVMARAPVTAANVAVHHRGVEALVKQGLPPEVATTAVVVVYSYVFGIAVLDGPSLTDIDDRRRLVEDARELLGDDPVHLESLLRSFYTLDGAFRDGLDIIVAGLEAGVGAGPGADAPAGPVGQRPGAAPADGP
jgi:AcrR family transcriptional regulator